MPLFRAIEFCGRNETSSQLGELRPLASLAIDDQRRMGGMLVNATLLRSRNFDFPNLGYGVGAISITPGSRDFETRESSGRRERNQPKRMSRRQSESGSDGESLRGEKLAKHWENKGQKRKQADVLRRRPAGITGGSN
jgi:hypothetical protein